MKETREEAIAAAAYGLLEQHGFAGTTMQAIARQARASMETFYRWYGDKTGLFRALIARNTAEVAAVLDGLEQGQGHPEQVGTALLTMLLGDRAVALNRAAAADPGGTLGAALAAGGREALLPRLQAMMQRERDAGRLVAPDAACLTELWLTLLIGDLQIRRVTGALPPLPPEAIAARSTAALVTLRHLYAPAANAYL